MGMFSGYRIEEDQWGRTLILFLNPSSTEFAEEPGSGSIKNSAGLLEQVRGYINQNLPDLKVSAVKLMVGSVLLATIPLGASGVYAEAPATASGAAADAAQQASYTSYKVAAGDSLWIISKKFNVSVDSIKALNGLTGDVIFTGTVLKIPSAAPSTAPATAYTTYNVVSGDSLWLISQKYGVSIDSIKTLNKLTTDVIYTGQQLKISSSTAAPAPSPTPAPAPASTQPYVTYTSHKVASGENAWTISLAYGIPMTELLKVNNLTNSSVLNIGQVLKIPVHVVPVMKTAGAQYGEYMDWWTGAQYVFPINAVAKVTDFKTGRSFTVKRTIGANHSDTEPLTAADAAVIKDIWGGSYSWTPRAVIVSVNGHRIAASMTSMPHSIEYITDNNFTGHFDIHFLNSTRHNDGLIDPSHQAQIKIAAGTAQ